MLKNSILTESPSPKGSRCKGAVLSGVKLEASLDMDPDIIPKMREQHFQKQWLSILNTTKNFTNRASPQLSLKRSHGLLSIS